jgi:hypothetical protein
VVRVETIDEQTGQLKIKVLTEDDGTEGSGATEAVGTARFLLDYERAE